MKKAGLQKNLRKYQRKCAALAVKLGKSFSSTTIHQFRIEYKKLRSFVALISFVSPPKRKFAIRKRAKKLYHLSGRIRDEFLFLQRFRLMGLSRTVFFLENKAAVKRAIAQLKNEWKKAKPFPSAGKRMIRPSSSCFPNSVSPADFSNYFESNERAIFSIINRKNLTDNQLHSLRKIVKERSYNLKWWEKLKSAYVISSKTGKQMAGLRQLMIDLGRYNDIVNFQRRLEKSRKRQTEIARRKELSLLQEKVNSEKQKINSKLVREIHRFAGNDF